MSFNEDIPEGSDYFYDVCETNENGDGQKQSTPTKSKTHYQGFRYQSSVNESPWPWRPDTTPLTESELKVPTPESYKRLQAHLASASSKGGHSSHTLQGDRSPTDKLEDQSQDEDPGFLFDDFLSPEQKMNLPSTSKVPPMSEEKKLRPTEIMRKKPRDKSDLPDSLSYSGASKEGSLLSMLSPFSLTKRGTPSTVRVSPMGGNRHIEHPRSLPSSASHSAPRSSSVVSSRCMHVQYATPSTGGSSALTSVVGEDEELSLLRRRYGITPGTGGTTRTLGTLPPSSSKSSHLSSIQESPSIDTPEESQRAPSTTLLQRNDEEKENKKPPSLHEDDEGYITAAQSHDDWNGWSREHSSGLLFSDGTTPVPILPKRTLTQDSASNNGETLRPESQSAAPSELQFPEFPECHNTVSLRDLTGSHLSVAAEDPVNLDDHWKELRERIDYMGFLDLPFEPLENAMETLRRKVSRNNQKEISDLEIMLLKTIHDMAVLSTQKNQSSSVTSSDLSKINSQLKGEIEERKSDNARLKKAISKMATWEKECVKMQNEKTNAQQIARTLEGQVSQLKLEIMEGKRKEKNLLHSKRVVDKDVLALRNQLEKLAEKESKLQKKARDTYEQIMRSAAKGGSTTAISSTSILGVLVDKDKRMLLVETDNRKLLYENTLLTWELETQHKEREKKSELFQHLGVSMNNEMSRTTPVQNLQDTFATKRLFFTEQIQPTLPASSSSTPEIQQILKSAGVQVSLELQQVPREELQLKDQQKLNKANDTIRVLQESVQDLQSRLFRFVGSSNSRDMIKRDKILHRLNLHDVADMDGCILAKIVQEVAVTLGSEDPTKLPERVANLQSIARDSEKLTTFVQNLFRLCGIENVSLDSGLRQLEGFLKGGLKDCSAEKERLVDLCRRLGVEEEGLSSKCLEEIECLGKERADHMVSLVEQSLKSIQVLSEVMKILRTHHLREVIPKLKNRLG